jgi:hypothetical protein
MTDFSGGILGYRHDLLLAHAFDLRPKDRIFPLIRFISKYFRIFSPWHYILISSLGHVRNNSSISSRMTLRRRTPTNYRSLQYTRLRRSKPGCRPDALVQANKLITESFAINQKYDREKDLRSSCSHHQQIPHATRLQRFGCQIHFFRSEIESCTSDY